MREARPDLYRAGVFRSYLLVVTDGENTSGSEPGRRRARDLTQERRRRADSTSSRSTRSPEKFAVLKEVGGDVIGAGTGAELHKALDGIYQGKILAEAPAGEREREPAKQVISSTPMQRSPCDLSTSSGRRSWRRLNKVANLVLGSAIPIAQMRYEYDQSVAQLKEGRGGLEQYRGLVERVTRQVPANKSHVQKLEARDQGLPEGRRSRHGREVRARAAEGRRKTSPPTKGSCRCTRRPTATA